MHLRSIFICIVFFSAALVNRLSAQVSIPASTIIIENFNSIGSSATATLPAGWRLSPSGNNVGTYSAGVSTTTQASSSGLPATGGRYNWATAAGTDRAVGFLTTAGYNSPNAIMAYYRNTAGTSVNTFTIAFAIERYVINTPGTFSLSFASSTDGTAWTAQTAGDISTADFPAAPNAGTFITPKTINKTLTVSVSVPSNGDIYFRWVFNTTNAASQGLGLDNVAVFAGASTPVIMATLKDILQVDNGVAGQFNEGDVIRYQTVVKNTGTGDAGNVQITLPAPPANTTMVPGSVKTSSIAVNDSYNASFNTLLNGSTVLVNDAGIPVPTAIVTYGPTADPTLYNAGVAGTTDAGGSITLLANGTFTYTAATGFSGIDKFKYITGNGNLPNNDAVVTITVGADISFITTNIDPSCNGGSNGSITFSATGGNGALTYSITGAAGTYFASNIFTGLAAGTYNLAVKDAGGLIKTATATLSNPAAIVVSGTVPALIYTTAMATAAFTKTGGTGTVVWSATGLPAGVTINSSTGDITGSPTVTGSFSVIITATDANLCTGTKSITITVAPKLSNDSYTAVGNTQLVADGHSAPATPFTAGAINILTNDASNAAITVTAGTFATTNGGSITIDAAGKFTYTPPNGSSTADSYTYTATSNTIAATAIINFTVNNMVWYVNNTYGGASGAANGSSHRPYTDVAAAATAAAASQIIYVHTGSGNTTGNAVLKSGQTLRGAGSLLTVGALSVPAGTKPTLTGMITLANSVTVDGFDMTTAATTAITSSGATGVTVSVGNITTSGAVNTVSLTNTTGSVVIAGGALTGGAGAVFNISGGTVSLTYSGNITQAANAAMLSVSGGHATGTILFQTGTLSATNGTGLQFDNADGTYNFNGTTTLNGGDAGIDILNGSAGTFSFAGGTAITNPANEVIKINAGTANITYSGIFSKTNNAVTGILINGETAGTITINGTGTKTLNTSTVNAVSLTTNTGATINFSGNNLLLTTSSGVGFNATGGGTISVTGTGNTITSTTGAALNVVSTTIGSSNINFRSISSNGSANGIVLNTTGNSGGLIVTGDAGTANNGSGGTISSATGHAILLTSTANVNLGYLIISNPGNNGVRGTTVNGFTLNRCTITDAAGNATTDDGIGLSNTSGALSITNCVITAARHQGITIDNFNTNMTGLTISSTSVTATPGGDGVLIQMRGSSVLTTGTIGGASAGLGNVFSNNSATGLQINNADNGNILNLNVQFNTCNANNAGMDFDVSQAASMTITAQNNTITNSNTTAMNTVASTTSSGGTLTITFRNNTIGIAGIFDSGSAIGNGIRVANGGTNVFLTIDGNIIREVPNGRGIDVEPQAYIPILTVKVKIVNNQIIRPSGTNQNIGCGFHVPCPSASIFILSDNNGLGGFDHVCTSVLGNAAYDPTSWPVGGEAAYYMARRTTTSNTLTLEGNTALTPKQNILGNNTVTNLTNPGVGDFTDEGAPGLPTVVVAAGTCGGFPARAAIQASEISLIEQPKSAGIVMMKDIIPIKKDGEKWVAVITTKDKIP